MVSFQVANFFFLGLYVGGGVPCANQKKQKKKKTKKKSLFFILLAVFDGWSTAILIKDFFDLISGNQIQPASSLALFSESVNRTSASHAESFWRQTLSNVSPTILSITLPTDVSLTQKVGRRVDSFDFSPVVSSESLKATLLALNSTMGPFLAALWAVVLAKYVRSQDVVFGYVVSGREANIRNIER
jgi:hypothetical protein